MLQSISRIGTRFLAPDHSLLAPLSYLALLAVGTISMPESAGEDEAKRTAVAVTSPQHAKFFETKIRPLLAAKCYRCHGPKLQKSGLRLDSRAGVLRGGESGRVIVAGQPEISPLIQAINYESLEMPPDKQLAQGEIAMLTRWVKLGVPWPETETTPVHGLGQITDEDRQYWAFQPIARKSPPDIDGDRWSRNAIDRFVLRKLTSKKLAPAPQADRRAMMRRAYFDLWGLPPAPSEIDVFVNNASPTAYEDLIDRLLASPHYGERWGRHWLDLVRYAESDGHHQDRYRPQAWRYRDYVVRSLNEDKPYNRFIVEQLAGDELRAENPDALIATGFLRHWIYEGNQRKVREVREIILNDVTDTTAEVFLGLSFGCARCHDHKFDPILQADYFRLQAFFAPMIPRDDVPAAAVQQRTRHQEQQAAWESMTAGIRREIVKVEAAVRRNAVNFTFKLFPQDVKDLYRKSAEERTVLEQLLANFAERHLQYEQRDIHRRLDDQEEQEWAKLQRRLQEFDVYKPNPLPTPMSVSDVGPGGPPTRDPGTGELVEPGFPVVLGGRNPRVRSSKHAPNSTGRRIALAEWIASPDNPLTVRVIVNRIWQYHFGRGLVGTTSDFGRLGDASTHSQLLEWLASEFIRGRWRFKAIHRCIMTSSTYRQSAVWHGSDRARRIDPNGRWLWRTQIRRLDAEQLRDAALATTGELDLAVSGPSVGFSVPRRTVYVKVMRNTPEPFMRAFDSPPGFSSTPLREITTTSTQALMLVNGEWMLARARALARRLLTNGANENQHVRNAYRFVYGREPDSFELKAGIEFLHRQPARFGSAIQISSEDDLNQQALVDFSHTLLNANEFIYVD